METECASCEVRTGLKVLLQVASISQLTVSRPSRQCRILNVSEPYRPPRPVTGIALFYFNEINLLSLCLCIPPSTSNAWTNISEILYVHHGAWSHMKAQFIIPSHQCVSVCVTHTVARQRHGRHVPAETNTRNSRTAGGVFSIRRTCGSVCVFQ
jgi:hypothetical protein